MKKTVFFILVIAALACSAPEARASSIESAVKNLDTSLNQLLTAKDEVTSENTLSPEEDLAFRKKVVNDALVLSFKEIDEIKNKLDSFKFDDKSTENNLRKQFFASLGEFEASYRDLQGKLDKETDVEKIKDIAKYAKEYREETYGPVIINVLDFILAFQADKLVANAEVRYSKIEADIKKLEKADFIETGYFSRQMEEAKKLISNAKGLINKAKAAIIEPPETPEIKEAKLDTTDQKSEDISETPPTPRELCEEALDDLKSGYNVFVDISGSVKKILKF